MEDLAGHVALGLTDVNNGTVYLNSNGDQGGDFEAAVSFSNKASTADCATTPNADNCHSQDVKIYSGEGDIQ